MDNKTDLQKEIEYIDKTINTKTLKDLQRELTIFYQRVDKENNYQIKHFLNNLIFKIENRIRELQRRKKLLSE
jgi:hypothetical protein